MFPVGYHMSSFMVRTEAHQTGVVSRVGKAKRNLWEPRKAEWLAEGHMANESQNQVVPLPSQGKLIRGGSRSSMRSDRPRAHGGVGGGGGVTLTVTQGSSPVLPAH